MNLAGVKPNKKTLTALMGACIAGKKYKAAADIFPKIKNPDNYAVSVGHEALVSCWVNLVPPWSLSPTNKVA